MATQIQLRRGTAAAWSSANPTLAVGEMGVETDTNKFKIGDGATVWNSLPYVSVTPIGHAASHQNGGSDEIATATPGANAIPKADGSSKLDGWVTADAAAGTSSLRKLGTGSTEACAGNDSRLSDARTPTSHAASHVSGGGDSIKLDDLAAPDDNTDLDASATKHGLLKKLSNVSTEFLNGQGNWATPAGGAQKSITIDIVYDTLRWLETNAISYILAADLIFRGTSVMGTPSAVKVLAWGTEGAPNAVAGVRLYDLTNAQTICENLNITNTTKQIVNLGSMSNWPAGEAILEVQIYRVSGAAATRAVISGAQIQF